MASSPSNTDALSGYEAGDCLVTAQRLDQLTADLAGLHGRMEGEIRQRLRDANADGDTDEQLAIREEEAILGLRIASLEALLHRCRVVDDASVADGTVVLGATVHLRDEDTRDEHSHVMVGIHEATRTGQVSVASPIGRALMGRRQGETVEVGLPGGRTRRLTIVSSGIGAA